MNTIESHTTTHGAIESVDSGARTITLAPAGGVSETLLLADGMGVMKGSQEIPLTDLDIGVKLSAEISGKTDGRSIAESVRIVEE